MSLNIVINPLKIIFLLFIMASCSTLVQDENMNKNNVIIYHDKFNRTPPSLNVLYGANLIENLLFFCETLDVFVAFFFTCFLHR